MASRATSPEPADSQKGGLLRALRCGGLTAACAVFLFGAGCPPRDSTIAITQAGTDYLVESCTRNVEYCTSAIDRYWAGMNCCNVLTIPPGAAPSSSPTAPSARYGSQLVTTNLRGPLQARLYLLTTNDFKVKSSSKCMNLKCGDGGTATGSTSWQSASASNAYLDTCLADALNQELDGAMPTGLSATGLKNSGDAILFMSIHEASDQDCSLDTIRACAGLAPLGGSTYDIVCASCNGGELEAVGSYTGPCPRSSADTPACFLNKCRSWLQAAGY